MSRYEWKQSTEGPWKKRMRGWTASLIFVDPTGWRFQIENPDGVKSEWIQCKNRFVRNAKLEAGKTLSKYARCRDD